MKREFIDSPPEESLQAYPINLLLVDDDPQTLEIQSEFLEENGIRVKTAETAELAIASLRNENFDVILTDLVMPEMSGIDLLMLLKEGRTESEVIIFTGYGTIESGIEAMRQGAFTYLVKPVDIKHLLVEIQKAARVSKLKRENFLLKHSDQRREAIFTDFKTSAMVELFKKLITAAESDSPILLIGENGTGKEALANFIHARSLRAPNALIKANCALSGMDEFELIFLGNDPEPAPDKAISRKGKLEMAQGGTLFLDEIGGMPDNCQTKLLSILNENAFEKKSINKKVNIDFRMIAGAHEEFQELVDNKKFREELFYKISVITIKIPALRDIKDDIPGLSRYLIKMLCNALGKIHPEITEEAISFLKDYSWPGNIRELQNVIERAIVLDRDGIIDQDDFPLEIMEKDEIFSENSDGKTTLKNSVGQYEKDFIKQALLENKENVTRTAKALGVSRRGLQQKMNKYGLK